VDIASQTCVIDGDSCPEFDGWLQLKQSDIAIDFQRIQKVGSGLRCFKDYDVNVSGFEMSSLIGESDEVGNEICHRLEDECLLVVKSILLSESFDNSRTKTAIENLIKLRHPCIAGPIGFIFPIESEIRQELKIVRLYFEGFSLRKVISDCPVWWTSTMKAKVIVGIVLGLLFAHSFGLIHGHLTSDNILFDSNDCIQIVNFESMLSEVRKMEGEQEEETRLGGFLSQRLSPEMDVVAFALILFEIVFGYPAESGTSILTDIPEFVSMIIESELCSTSTVRYSFNDIFSILTENNFKIEDDVDSAEVSRFVRWVESAEYP
jgi:serine/threonine protein kinase